MPRQANNRRLTIIKIESYDGDGSFIHCGNDSQDFLYAVVSVDSDGTAELIDCGYASHAEALQAWPEARCPQA